MKNRFYQVTAVAVSTLALSTAMHNSSVPEFIYDSALTGGGLWASATSIESVAVSVTAKRH